MNMPLYVAHCDNCAREYFSYNMTQVQQKAEAHMMETGHVISEIKEEY